MNSAVRFKDLPPLPAHLVVPRWLALTVAISLIGGAVLGLSETGPLPKQVVRAIFFASAFGYLTVSLLDFYEHFRLEKEATGRWLACAAIPIGETINHALTGATIAGAIILVRPLGEVMEPRDWFTIFAPLIFLGLGWRDELVYHRRRSQHREDIMHTVAHLAAGVMLGSLYVMRIVDWTRAARHWPF